MSRPSSIDNPAPGLRCVAGRSKINNLARPFGWAFLFLRTGEDSMNANANDNPRIGFIGLGLMGHGMAKNIVKKGFPLSVRVHRNRKPLEDILAAGAKEVSTNAELVQASDIVFLCVTGTPQIESIVYGHDGLLAA